MCLGYNKSLLNKVEGVPEITRCMCAYMLFFAFFIAAGIVIFSAIRVTSYVTAFNQKINVSAGFVGLVVFSLITSLPELITSSYSVILGQPLMSFGNILGSNAFNILILTVLNLVFLKKRIFNAVSKTNRNTMFLIIALNCIVLLGLYYPVTLPIPFFNISAVSGVIFLVYAGVLFYSYKFGEEEEEPAQSSSMQHLQLKQIFARGMFFILVMIVFSLAMTKISDRIVLTYPQIGATLAGTLLLAVATSLPELVTTYALCKTGHANVAIAGIIGSSLFNFTILFVVDLLTLRMSVFQEAQISPEIDILKLLVLLGIYLSTYLSVYFVLASKLKKVLYILMSAGLIASYFYFIQRMFG